MHLKLRKPSLRAAARLAALAAVGLLACGPSTEAPDQTDPPDRGLFEAGRLQFPAPAWVPVDRPAEWGWSEDALREAEAYFEGLDSAAVMVIHRGVAIAAWGDIAARYNGQSLRKPLLGALLGQEVAAGRIDLDETLEELGIDDASHPLTETERQARVIDLVQSRSGVYLPAIYEAGGWKRNKPERASHRPGQSWYYNNWGFNALGTLFEQVAGETVARAFDERIAEEIGMEDFRPGDVKYLSRNSLTEKIQGNDSEHRAYVFMISARDLARFGLLYLANGDWNGKQVLPASWVERSTSDHVETLGFLQGDRFGYLWWVSPAESAFGSRLGHASYRATGGRGHALLVVPDLDLVVVHRLATGGVGFFSQLKRRFLGAPGVDDSELAELMLRIADAHPASSGEA